MVYYFTLRLYNRLHSVWRHDGVISNTRPASPSGISYNKIRFQLNPTPDKTANKLNLQQPKKNHIIFPAEGNKIGGNPASSMQSKLLLFDGINRNKGFGERPNALGSIANAQQTQQFVR